MATRMQQRRGTAAEWTASNEILPDGAVGVETDTGKLKVGNGVNGWNALFYVTIPPGIFDAVGDLLVGTGDNTYTKLPHGTNGQRLQVAADGTLVWVTPVSGVPISTVTTAGDLIVGSGAGAVARLGIGASQQVLAVVSGALTWVTPSADVPLSTITAAGDLVLGSGAGTVSRLAKGANGTVLGVTAGVVGWVTPSADVPLSLITTAEDIIVGTGAGAVKRLAKGANGTVLTISGGGAVSWAAPSADVPLSTVTTAEDLIVGSGASTVKRVGKGANGQFLSVVAGVLTWVTSPDVPLATVTTAGDLIVGSGASTVARLAKGANGKHLGVVGGSVVWDTNTGITPCTAATRPASPYAGQAAYETDTGNFIIWNGILGAWDVSYLGSTINSFGTRTGRFVLSGTFSMALSSGSVGPATVTFGFTFVNTPVVLISPTYNVTATMVAANPRPASTTAFDYYAKTLSGTFTGSVTANYVATDA